MTDAHAPDAGTAQAKLPPLDQRTTPEGAHRVLRLAILGGLFVPGSQLREAGLAADLGISRAPLREAFSRLEEEGLLVRVPFRGAFVAEVSPRTIEEIAALRYLLEPYAAERTATHLGEQTGVRVQELVGALRSAADQQDMVASVDAHLAFHRFFYQHSGNALLAETWSGWENRLRLFLAVDHRVYDNLDELASTHERLAELIETGNMQRFRTELAHHVHKAPGAPLDE
ncbi:GntR family transcriptional regulator [Cryptosporangium sp. NPDC051539]|uniref:GntR family transcriptional regulator n=1 Tax=Cryptosporangium sp. NPDC051539 TaxID=3363962 RepID=UPI0037A62F72